MKRALKQTAVNLDQLNGQAANLRAVAGDDMMQAAFTILRDRMNLTPEKVALMLLRMVNPDELIEQGEECKLRGAGHRDTLRGYKQDGLLPHFINGIHYPAKATGQRA